MMQRAFQHSLTARPLRERAGVRKWGAKVGIGRCSPAERSPSPLSLGRGIAVNGGGIGVTKLLKRSNSQFLWNIHVNAH